MGDRNKHDKYNPGSWGTEINMINITQMHEGQK